MNNRTLQDILRAEQIRLETTHHHLMRRVVKERIQMIASELLHRWRRDVNR